MQLPSNRTKRIVTASLLVAMALAVQWLESFLPAPVPGIPVRIGFSNIFVLMAFLYGGRLDAFAVAMVKSILLPLLSGNVSGGLYALFGSFFAWAGMAILLGALKKDRISSVGLSVCGAFLFQFGQSLAGMITVGNAMLIYFPFMALISIPAGVVTGFLTELLRRRFPNKNEL